MDGARLERRQPVGVDVRQHARGGAELQQRDVLALGDCARQLRLDLHDLRIGEPADQVDVVHGEIDHHTDIGHARWERADAGNGDREDVLILDRALDRLNRRIEALDVADHQRHAGATGRGDDGAPFLDRRRNRFLHHHVNAARNTVECDVVVQMSGCGDRHRLDAAAEQRARIGEFCATKRACDLFALLAVGIGDPDQLNAGDIRQHAGMIAAHHTDADDTNFQRTRRTQPSLTHDPKGSLNVIAAHFPLAWPKSTGDP